MTPRSRLRPSLRLSLPLLAACLAAPSWGQPLRDGATEKVIETPYGKIYKVHRSPQPRTFLGDGPPSFDGDTYDFQHQLGALIDNVFQCFKEHMADMDDNTTLFDGLSELLDPYLDGTQPQVFEFESPDTNEGTTDVTMSGFTKTKGGDLFPEGFEDPETNTPLTDACIEIGIDDTLDADGPVEVTNATLSLSNPNGVVIPPVDITDFFDSPWDGRLSIVFSGLTGMDINSSTVQLQTQPIDPSAIFSDGFESGDATAWQ